VTNALERRLTQEEFDPATRGRLFEHWVVLECLRHVDLARSGARLYFWRTNTGAEVDLLVEKHGRIQAAIEIKSSRTIDVQRLERSAVVPGENPDVPSFVVTPTARPHRLDSVLVTNWRDVLAMFGALL